MIKIVLGLIVLFLIAHILFFDKEEILKEGLENSSTNPNIQTLVFKNAGTIASLKESVDDLKSHLDNLDVKATQALSISQSNQNEIQKGKDTIKDSQDKVNAANAELEKLNF